MFVKPERTPWPLLDGAFRTGESLDAIRVRDLLLRISRELSMSLDLDEILQRMVDAALFIAPMADKCVIHLLSADATMLYAQVCSEPTLIHGMRSKPFPANLGIAGRALRENSTVYVEDITRALDFVPRSSGPELRSLLVAPLYVGEMPLGTLSLSSADASAFDEDACHHIGTLAAQAAVAIHQSNLLLDAVTERERSEAIIEGMTNGLVILDGTGQITRVNPALCQLLELPAEALDLPCAVAETNCAALRDVVNMSGEVLGAYVVEVDLPSGSRATLHVTPSALNAPASGEIRIVHDVTLEREEAQARSLFISKVSHDLRAPLQHILSFASIIRDLDDLPREDYMRFVGYIQDETDHMGRLVSDLVELAKIETGRFSVYLEDVQLDAQVRSMVERLAPRAEARGIELVFEDHAGPTLLLSDSLRLDQVLGNLIENAIKFVPSGGKITAKLHRDTRHATVYVTDTGPGIAPEALPFVFDSFYQVTRRDTQRKKGMGLGLFISQEIIRGLGGRIWVESVVGEGTSFAFELPLVGDA